MDVRLVVRTVGSSVTRTPERITNVTAKANGACAWG